MKILLIIPAYNEEASLLNIISEVEVFRKTAQFHLDYVVINDGSTDATETILQKHDINHVELIMNLGIGGAVQTGYKYALMNDYDIAVQFDGDGQHDIQSLTSVVTPILEKQANLIVGSRFINTKSSEFQTTFMRRVGINIISFFIKMVSGIEILDTTSGYRAADRSIIKLFSERYPIKYPEPGSIVYAAKKGFVIKECEVNMFERKGGRSSITPVKSVRYMIEVCSSILVAFLMKEND